MKQQSTPLTSGPKHPLLVPPVTTPTVPLLSRLIGAPPPPPPPRSPSTQLSRTTSPVQKRRSISPFKAQPKSTSAFESEAFQQVSVRYYHAKLCFGTIFKQNCHFSSSLANFAFLYPKSKRNYL